MIYNKIIAIVKKMEQLRKLNRILKSLSDEGRLRIVFLLNKKKSLCVNEIREIIDLSQPTISSHLEVLEYQEIMPGLFG